MRWEEMSKDFSRVFARYRFDSRRSPVSSESRCGSVRLAGPARARGSKPTPAVAQLTSVGESSHWWSESLSYADGYCFVDENHSRCPSRPSVGDVCTSRANERCRSSGWNATFHGAVRRRKLACLRETYHWLKKEKTQIRSNQRMSAYANFKIQSCRVELGRTESKPIGVQADAFRKCIRLVRNTKGRGERERARRKSNTLRATLLAEEKEKRDKILPDVLFQRERNRRGRKSSISPTNSRLDSARRFPISNDTCRSSIHPLVTSSAEDVGRTQLLSDLHVQSKHRLSSQ